MHKRRRYFVEKFPLAASADGSIGLTYIDAGEYAVEGLDTFLKRYTRLIVSVPDVRLTYVADTDRNFAQATRCFEGWRKTADDLLGFPRDPDVIARMLRHFADLHLIETNQLAKFPAERFPEFRRDRTRFQNRECTALYRVWEAGGDDAVRTQIAHATRTSALRRVEFATYQLPHDYSALGAPMYVD